MIFVSACLLGQNCKYNGGNNQNEKVISYLRNKEYLPICPECAGGLASPRPPGEIQGSRVVDKDGNDITAAFNIGAEIILTKALELCPTLCILKANSPSCGVGTIYDGSFTGKKIKGNGISAGLLLRNGFSVVTEENIEGCK